MRLIIFLFILISEVYAKSSQSCYTVQLQSALYSQESLQRLTKKEFPSECSLMRISNTLTVRCGCYEDIDKAKKELPKYKQKYKYAYLATSYKYRFKKNAPSQMDLQHQSHVAYSSDEELKLMLQAFLYSSDLEHAYKTAKLGYERHPNSYYWNQKMAEVCKWSGRSSESIKYMEFMYHKKHDTKLAKDIIDFGLGTYQYEALKNIVTQEAKTNPSKENIDRMVYIYFKIGEPEAAAKILEKLYSQDNSHPEYLNKALQIYMEMEDLDAAQRIITILEKKNLYSMQNVQLLAYYYYSQRNIAKAFEVLNKPVQRTEYDKKYLQLKSDLGWYLEAFKPAAKASLQLIEHKDGRLVDYERVIAVNRHTNKSLATKTALQAYNKFHLSYLFYLFANELIKENDIATLQKAITSIDAQKDAKLKNESQYWIIKAILYHQKNQQERSREAIERAVSLNPDSLQLKFTALSLYQEYGMFEALHKELDTLTTDITMPHEFYFRLASLAYAIHDINLANYYLQKLLQEKDPVVNAVEFKFLQAELYRAKNNENAYLGTMRSISSTLNKELKKNPALNTDDIYLNNKLRADISLVSSDSFTKELQKAKPYLSKEHYDDLAYTLALKDNAQEKAHLIYTKIKNKAIWMQFSDAVMEQDHSRIEDILTAYLHTIAMGEASHAAENDGQTALAQSMAYQALNYNDDNQNAYIALLDLSKKRADATDVKLSYYNRDPLLRKYISINNSNYINNSYYLLSNLNYYKNSDLDNNLLREVPDDTLEFNVGLKKVFDKAELTLFGGYANSMDSYFVFSVFGKYQLTKELNIGGGLYKNVKTDESTQLLLGGKKDKIELRATYSILNSTALELLYEHNRYNSQDDVYLGDGEYIRANMGHQIRNGYPDMRLSLFSDAAVYNEKSGSKGVIDKLRPGRGQVLPNNFMNLGVDFAYGMQNSEIYTRVWRPYFEVSSYYNTDLAAFSYGFNAGYGGKVYSQDHLIIGTSYTNDVNGIGGSIFELFLKYKFLYTHR